MLALAGCGGEPEPPPPPGPRELVESQVRVYTDRVLAILVQDPDPIVSGLASSPDSTGGFYPRDGYRAAVEEDGRNLCSHIIADVPPEQAWQAAYPQKPGVTSQERQIAKIAADTLCPTT